MAISMQSAIEKLCRRQDLHDEEMAAAMRAIMSGQVPVTQIAGFLVGLRVKGETVAEITAAAKVLREFADKVNIDAANLIDIVGTGGDNSNLFNISTLSAFVVAAAGATVAKHGNRSVSSKSGSADVLEAAGANLQLTPLQVKKCIDQIGIGFLFAPTHHNAMRHVALVRKELGVRTIFNMLGPLINPANVSKYVLGVYDKKWLLPFAEVCRSLGSEHVLVVHSEDGLDEISLAAPTHVVELRAGVIENYTVQPEDFGIKKQSIEPLCVENTEDSLAFFRCVLANEASPARDIIALNAGSAIYVAGLTKTIALGIEKAYAVIASGAAKEKFDKFIAYTQDVSKS